MQDYTSNTSFSVINLNIQSITNKELPRLSEEYLVEKRFMG